MALTNYSFILNVSALWSTISLDTVFDLNQACAHTMVISLQILVTMLGHVWLMQNEDA